MGEGKGANVWGGECSRGRMPAGIVRSPYATADRAGLPGFPGPI